MMEQTSASKEYTVKDRVPICFCCGRICIDESNLHLHRGSILKPPQKEVLGLVQDVTASTIDCFEGTIGGADAVLGKKGWSVAVESGKNQIDSDSAFRLVFQSDASALLRILQRAKRQTDGM